MKHDGPEEPQSGPQTHRYFLGQALFGGFDFCVPFFCFLVRVWNKKYSRLRPELFQTGNATVACIATETILRVVKLSQG